MLLLNRKAKHGKNSLWIDGALVVIKSVDKQSGDVVVGVQADKSVKVLRGELADKREEKA